MVIGDVILDIYLKGEVKRISPEAPVPILNVAHKEYRLGGGGNVAANLANMGVPVTLASVVGADKNGEALKQHLKKAGISIDAVLSTKKRKTSVKTRVIAQSQQIVRIDEEDGHDLEKNLIHQLLDKLKKIKGLRAIIISDYGKGVISKESFAVIRDWAKEKKIFISLDPKQRNFPFYTDIDVMTPNHFEAADSTGMRCETMAEVKQVGKEIIAKHNLKELIITRGEKGMTLFENNPVTSTQSKRSVKRSKSLPVIYNLPTFNRSLYDVSGAGDTVIALYTAAYIASGDSYLSAVIANMSAGIVVAHFGTCPITLEDFNEHLVNKQFIKKIIEGKHYENL